MKYRHKQTGEVVYPYAYFDPLFNTCVVEYRTPNRFGGHDEITLPEKKFHANYEPLEEGGQDE